MRRKIVILVAGLCLLLAFTWVVGYFGDYVIPHPTPHTQTTQVGSYTVSLSVDPNPPPLNPPALLSIQVQYQQTHQPVSGLHVVIDGAMESMDMGTTEVVAKAQSAGLYTAHFPFAMSGPWQLQIALSNTGQPVLNAVFTISTQ
jgi:hypothetical protein